MNDEIKRRSEVCLREGEVDIFPNEAAITRLVSAILLGQNDEWSMQRRYLSLESLPGFGDHANPRLPAIAA